MHAFGNDFVVFDFRTENTDKVFTANEVIYIADRNFGIGADQVISIYKSDTPDDEKYANVNVRVHNVDGSEASQCGNGMRCISGFVVKDNPKPLVRVNILTTAGNGMTMVAAPNLERNSSKVKMGIPVFEGDVVNMGNKHKIIIVENFDSMNMKPDGEFNISYVQVKSRTEIFMRTVERGVGETMSCGSASCAAVAHCIKNNLTDREVSVMTRGSDIMDSVATISWKEDTTPILMDGTFTTVFTGEIPLK